jgi:hypothetical protein
MKNVVQVKKNFPKPSQAKAPARVLVSHLFAQQPPVSGLIVISSRFPHAK